MPLLVNTSNEKLAEVSLPGPRRLAMRTVSFDQHATGQKQSAQFCLPGSSGALRPA